MAGPLVWGLNIIIQEGYGSFTWVLRWVGFPSFYRVWATVLHVYEYRTESSKGPIACFAVKELGVKMFWLCVEYFGQGGGGGGSLTPPSQMEGKGG